MQKKESTTTNIPPFVYFGGPAISVNFIETCFEHGIVPDLIVTTPDMPVGRRQTTTAPPLKQWAEKHDVRYVQPQVLRDDVSLAEQLAPYDLFIVVAYAKIIPQNILDIPDHGSINLHPSLLPKYRGPSPIISALLADEKETGLSLMLLDEHMDHGPLLAQKNITINEWVKNDKLEEQFAHQGAELFASIIDDYLTGAIQLQEQDHENATYCHKYHKKDMELDMQNPRSAFLTYCAFQKPFFFYKDKRIIVTDAQWTKDTFVIHRVIPEGKKEMLWNDYKQSIDK